MIKTMRAPLAVLVLLGIAACGSPPEAKAPEPEPAPPPPPPPSLPAVSQELGSIDEAATQKTFERLQSKLLDCQKQGMKRIDYLSGDVRFFLRVGADGRARYAYLEDSTLGDRDTERCMLDAVRDAQWPKPEGGEAEVRKSIGFDAGEARPPAEWNSDKIALVLAKQADDALKCKEGVKGTFKVTAYVVPGPPKETRAAPSPPKDKHHNHAKKPHEPEGHAEAVGVAPPNKDGESKVDCIVEAVKEWKMPSPGSYAAKVSFNL